jgi:hypothetical protein
MKRTDGLLFRDFKNLAGNEDATVDFFLFAQDDDDGQHVLKLYHFELECNSFEGITIRFPFGSVIVVKEQEA